VLNILGSRRREKGLFHLRINPLPGRKGGFLAKKPDTESTFA